MTTYYAHSEPYPGGPKHPLRDHISGVTDLAQGFASAFGMQEEAQVAGLLHDLGKYGDLFKKRLENPRTVTGIDHWTIGAWVAYQKYGSSYIAPVIQGHHVGLQSGASNALINLDPKKFEDPRIRLSEANEQLLLERLKADHIQLPVIQSKYGRQGSAGKMLRTRFLFSSLVDADFLDTESHFNRKPDQPKAIRESGPELDIDRAIAALDIYRERFNSREKSPMTLMREEVSEDCAKAAQRPTGLFTLTAPTGSGKTIAMLRFALLHAKKNGLRRIVVVLPFLTLIEQTSKIYREVFKDFPESFVLEDHSLARDEMANEDGVEAYAKLLSENWDAPIIITTNIRFFEALHHNRPSVCRKLHRLARAVILCDEVQSLPTEVSIADSWKPVASSADKTKAVNLVVPTLATISSLAGAFGATVVFATATQPAFRKFEEAVMGLSPHGWKPREIMARHEELFERSARVHVEWRFETQSWESLAAEISMLPGTLVIVNTRKDAKRLTELLKKILPYAPVRHLSTNMCVAHRQVLLGEIEQLNLTKEGFLISTQCVEAGVDLDFRQVYRAWAPLDSIAQAAGRCNRNWEEACGLVVVFSPEDPAYPPGGYKQATQVARKVVQQVSHSRAFLHDPVLFRKYFEQLYGVRGLGSTADGLLEQCIHAQSYVDVASLYRLIPESGVNVIVNVGDTLGAEHKTENAAILDRIEAGGLTAKLKRAARSYTVSTFEPNIKDLPFIRPKDRRGEAIPGWFILDRSEAYDGLYGLLPSEGSYALQC